MPAVEDDEIALRDEELAETHARLDAALNNMAHGLMMIDADLRVVLRNRQMLLLFQLDQDVVRPGASMAEVIAHSVSRGNHPGLTAEQVGAEIEALTAAGQRASFQRSMPDGRLLSIHWEPMPGGGWVCTYEDITARETATAQVAHLASHDAVTGLPNRLTLHEALCRAMRQGAPTAPGPASIPTPARNRTRRGYNLLCFEIDRFRTICDTRGHRAGDLLLAHVGRVLAACVRQGDLVAYLGGSSFAILQATTGGVPAALRVAARVVEAVRVPVSLEGRMIMATVSVGVAGALRLGLDPADNTAEGVHRRSENVLRNATLALHRAVADGGGLIEVYAPDMDRTAQERHALEVDLRAALAGNQFELHYQPLVCAESHRVTGFEALLRWRHPERGLVSPASFIPLAEELGLIGAIGAWALRTACREASTWSGRERIAVNLSPLQFGHGQDLPSLVAAILAETGLAANRLELEITESVHLQDSTETLGMLHALRATGVRVALDDFGTGYSSLSYLRCFPFDKLKIDQSFVRGLPEADSLAIVRAVLALGRSLGMSIVAEGVETPAQLALLTAEGCQEMQGYLFSKPKPAADVRDLIDTAPLWQQRL